MSLKSINKISNKRNMETFRKHPSNHSKNSLDIKY